MTVDLEPTFMALGERHVGVGMNNKAWFYSIEVREACAPMATHPGGVRACAASPAATARCSSATT